MRTATGSGHTGICRLNCPRDRAYYGKLKKSPPKARLTVRIGVIGHRPTGLELADTAALKSKAAQVLQEIKRLTHDIKKASGSLYTTEDPVLRIISPLAEGADMLVAEVALENGFELQCALPFEREEYENDFSSEASTAKYREMLGKATAVFELEGSRRKKALEDDSYQAVGRMVINQSDVIIAIWDGKDAKGKGETGQMVSEALLLEIPVVWIDSATPHEIKVLTGKDYGKRGSGDLIELESRMRRRKRSV